MALDKFEVTQEHLNLLKHLQWDVSNNSIYTPLENGSPYGGDSFYSDIGLVLYGKPEKEFDPLAVEDVRYSDEQKAEMEKLFGELPIVLSIVLLNGDLTPGHYRKKWNRTDWKRYTPSS